MQVKNKKTQRDMASNQKITYPLFYANQVLRSSTLNNSFAFVDRQTRLSRVHFLGCGIVEGLEFSLSDDALVIERGVAVNKDGWLVEIPEKTEYRYVADVDFSEADFLPDEEGKEPVANLDSLMAKGGSRIQKICFRTEDDVRQYDNRTPERISSLAMDKYVVALAFGMRREYSSRCSQDSCDLNTADQVLEVWPVLIEVGDVKSLFRKISPLNLSVSPRKEPCLESYHGDVASFNAQVLTSARYWESEVDTAMASIEKYLHSLPWEVWNHVFSDRDVFDRFTKARNRIKSLVASKVLAVPDYYISFFGDLVLALNEFIDGLNAFAFRYKVLPDQLPSDMLVYLGRLDEEDREGDAVYRSVFKGAMDEEMCRDSVLLEQLLVRICTLTERFIGDVTEAALSKQSFRLMKVRPAGRLSSRPVPFYDDTSKGGVSEAWNADRPYAAAASGG